MAPKTVTIGLVGAGYAAWLHGTGYEKVGKIIPRIKSIADIDLDRARHIADLFGIETITARYEDLIEDPEIDVIDIVTPPFLHKTIIEKALAAGKHVICEKPLCGYFGRPEDSQPIGAVSKAKMLAAVCEELDELKAVVSTSKGKFMYAENFVYCPAMVTAGEMIRRKQAKILFLKGEESLKGSSSAMAGRWDKTGGGSLMRVGCHPLTGMLWLKQQEAQARGETITVKSVTACMNQVIPTLTEADKRYIDMRPVDVEDLSTVTILFSDGTMGLVIANDVCLGGAKNYVEAYCSSGNFICSMTPTDLLQTYLPDNTGVEDMDLGFGLSTKSGWNKPFVSDDVIRGYVGEFQDFLTCVAEDRQPQSGFDLAAESLRVIYAAYQSAEEGRTIVL